MFNRPPTHEIPDSPIWLSSVGKVKFEFTGKTNVVEISNHISRMVL